MKDPMSEIEDKQSQFDIGVAAYRIFSGARSEGASRMDAFQIVWAWFGAMFESAKEDDEDGS